MRRWPGLLLFCASSLAVPEVLAARSGPPPDPVRQRAESYRLFLEAQEMAGAGKTREARRQLDLILQTEPEAVPVWVALARICLREGDGEAAGKAALRALAIDPEEAEAHKILAELALARYQRLTPRDPKDLDGALEHFSRAARARPQDQSAWLAWIRLLGMEGRYDEAEEVARRAGSQPGIDPAQPWMALVRILSGRGENARLEALLGRVQLTGPVAIPLLEALVEVKAARRDFEGQAEALDRLRSLKPEDPEIARRLGAARLELADPWGALTVLQTAFAALPADPLIRRDLARSLVRLGRGAEALDLLAGIPEVFRSRQTLLIWAQGAEQAGRWAEAADRFAAVAAALNSQEKADMEPGLRLREARARLKARQTGPALALLDPLPPVAAVVRLRLEILDAQGGGEAAENILADLRATGTPEGLALELDRLARLRGGKAAEDRVAGLAPHPAENGEKAGRAAGLLLSWNRPGVARALVEPLAGGPDAPYALRRVLAAALQALGRREQAEIIYRSLLAGDPEDAGVQNDLGFLLASDPSRAAEALALIEKAVAKDPEVGAYQDSLGFALIAAGRAAEAVAPLRRAVRLSSERDEPEIREHLGDAYRALGDRERALAEWTAAWVLGEGGHPDLKKKIESLESPAEGR